MARAVAMQMGDVEVDVLAVTRVIEVVKVLYDHHATYDGDVVTTAAPVELAEFVCLGEEEIYDVAGVSKCRVKQLGGLLRART